MPPKEAAWTTTEVLEMENAKTPHSPIQLNTVTHWCQRGIFPGAKKINNRWFIPISSYNPETFQRPQQGKAYAKQG